ncbi:MAG TPA: class I SAM-dependent methyltransferase [Verrucomicrobiae bacterium]|jgi:SAM-dependent methyltransferase
MPLEQAQRHYSGEAGRSYHQVKRGIPQEALPWVARLRARKFSEFVRPDDIVLEYGVGSGWNLAELRCRRKIGFDISTELEANVCRLGIEFVTDTVSLSDDSADIVLCHHALEHVLNPPETLKEIRRLLKPGGKLLLYVPLEREARYDQFRPDEPNHHLYSWNPQTLGNLVQECGFKVKQAGTGEFGYSRFAAVWASKLSLGENGFRLIRRIMHIVIPAFETRILATKESL